MKKDDSFAMINADKYYFGIGVEKNFETAFHWYLQAAKSGNDTARTQVGLMYYNGIGTTVNYDEAFKWLNFGFGFLLRNAPATYTLAEMYFYGRGTKQNYLRAFHLYDLALGGGYNINAAFRLGEMCEYGYGVEVDNQLAIKYYVRAANNGNEVAMNKLGLIYETGEIVEQDYNKARQWYFLAAQKGNAFAAAKLEELPESEDS